MEPALIQAELTRILASDGFVRSKRLSEYLAWLVEKSLDDKAGDISEYAIGFEVYQRGPDFDPQVDGTVRVETYRLRKKLREYYASAPSESALRIVIPKGSYAPQFVAEPADAPIGESFALPPVPEPALLVAAPISVTSAPNVPRHGPWSMALAAAALLALCCLRQPMPQLRLDAADVETLLARAESRLAKLDYPGARTLLEKAVRGGTRDSQVFAALSLTYGELGLYREGNQTAQLAMSNMRGLTPKQQLVVETRIRIGSGAWDEAARAAQKLIDEDPANLDGRLRLAQAMSRTGRFRESLDALNSLRGMPGGPKDGRIERIEALDYASLNEWQRALASVREAERLSKASGMPSLHARSLLLEGGIMQTMALPDFGRVRDEAGQECARLRDEVCVVRALRVKANELFGTGRVQEAVKAFDDALTRARRIGDPLEISELLVGKACAARELELPDLEASAIQEGLETVRRTNLPFYGFNYRRISWLIDRGMLADAELLEEETMDAARRASEDPLNQANVLIARALVRTAGPHAASASGTLDEATRLVERDGYVDKRASLAVMQAEMLRREGDSNGAERALAHVNLESDLSSEALWNETELVQVLIANGQLDRAESEIARLSTGNRSRAPSAALVEQSLSSLVAAKRGKREVARERALSAVRSLRNSTPAVYRALAQQAVVQASPQLADLRWRPSPSAVIALTPIPHSGYLQILNALDNRFGR
jgi:tetratricopeptide (TPR) repeat protein